MLKTKTIAFVLCGAFVSLLGAQDLKSFSDRYRSAYNARQRMAIIREAADARPEGIGSLYAEALSGLLLEYPNIKSTEDRVAADSMTRLLAGLLGDDRYLPASRDLWRVVQTFVNPLVRADALIALGQLRAADQLEAIALLLQDLNLQPGLDPEASEKVAYGAVLSLEKYRNIRGYAPVFMAANSWYSDRTRKQAEAALSLITDNPTSVLLPVIASAALDIRRKALEKIDTSQAPAGEKYGAALTALGEGWKIATTEVKIKIDLAALRKTAITMMVTYGSDAAAVGLLEKSYKYGYDFEEKNAALSAYAKNPSAEAAAVLSAFMTDLNKKRQIGAVTAEEDRLVRVLIPAMGANGQPSLKAALQDVEYVGWTNAITGLAADALKKLR